MAYYQQEKLYYSCIHGGGLYEWNGEKLDSQYPLLNNVMSGERFFAKLVRFDAILPSYIRYILDPADREVILWPSDIIKLRDIQDEAFDVFAENEYKDVVLRGGNGSYSYALLFEQSMWNSYLSLEYKLNALGYRKAEGWRLKEIQKMAVDIVSAIKKLNSSGYAYYDIQLSRFLYVGDRLYLDFSNLLHMVKQHDEPDLRVDKGVYPLEFAEPYVAEKEYGYMDIDTQNYSLAALLFYMLYGRYAYDGPLLHGFAASNIQQHYVKFEMYHKLPVFIFDKEDDRNRLGTFVDEESVIALWDESPSELRQMFEAVLKGSNATRREFSHNPKPEDWLNCFKTINWI